MVVAIAGALAGRKTAHEYVKDSLREAIMRGAIPGGTRLVQADVASELQVSTTPVREALRDLATEGLIRLDPHRGAIVHQLSYAETLEIHSICRLLEPEAMRQATKVATPETISQAQALAELMADESDAGRWADLNRQFHATLIQDIESRYLLDIMRTLRDTAAVQVGRMVAARPEYKQLSNRDHEEFVRIFRRGDGTAASRLAKRHLDHALQAVRATRTLMET